MNRYVLRSLAAVLTFLIGLAVSPSPRPFKHRRFKLETLESGDRHCHRKVRQSYPVPTVSIDAVATDPVKLSYSQTHSSPDGFRKQKVEFLLDAKGRQNINNVVIRYRGRSAHSGRGSDGALPVMFDGSTPTEMNLQTVSLDCDADESLWLWIAYIEFKNGTRWTNPRHSDDQLLQ